MLFALNQPMGGRPHEHYHRLLFHDPHLRTDRRIDSAYDPVRRAGGERSAAVGPGAVPGLKISALTVKKAYDALEEEGLTATIHGKGTYVCAPNRSLIQEEQLRDLERDLEAVAEKAKRYGVGREELAGMLDIIMEG